ncbi:MAG: hypothetical protein APF76_00850 [Desulfitibacter sp. BRH_c19]|nr:MAG: hypothetical protein APF76_00850 [Desulfitibacter sp. BRH_c19]
MKVLLVKCHKKTLFSIFEPIVTEPLELEYLSGLLTKMDIHHRIFNSLMEDSTFEKVMEEYHPDVLVLTGYITAVETMISFSQYAKSLDRNMKVIVGGVHAEINYEDFFVETIDFIVHSDPIHTFEKLINNHFCKVEAESIQGIAFYDGKKWQVNSKSLTKLEDLPFPNRTYFKKYKHKTKYLQYSPIAIIKTALSCPFQCNFCYCRLLNMGTYSNRTIRSVVEEIKTIDAEYIWIVDDTFLLDRERIVDFIHETKNHKLHKKFIAYSRVDFVAKNEDIIKKLAEIGFVELIIGMEAIEDQKLEMLNKQSSSDENIRAVEILRKYGIRLTALFIVGIDFTFTDFRRLRKWIRTIGLCCYAVSIFTPLKGTDLYKAYKDKIINNKYASYDFLHLTIKPTKIPAVIFCFLFYLLYVEQFFRSSYIRGAMMKTLRSIFVTGGKP